MKIILSCKGFDSTYGKVASPIFPDGKMLSLPIPSDDDGLPAEKCLFGVTTLFQIIEDLIGECKAPRLLHLDPDLVESSIEHRKPGWRQTLGQAAQAQAHLDKQGVGVGDLFLFFGWFRQTHFVNGHWAYKPNAPDIHALFGWLQVGRIIQITPENASSQELWLCEHPHVRFAEKYRGMRNTIYIAGDQLEIDGELPFPAAGVFSRWIENGDTTLSAVGGPRSRWKVPRWLKPTGGKTPLTYHGSEKRWCEVGEDVYLRVVSRGQEFVLHTEHYPEARMWARNIIRDYAT